MGSGSGVVGVGCSRANNDTRIWFFWHSGLMPGPLVAGLPAVDVAVDDATDTALDVTCNNIFVIIVTTITLFLVIA